MSKKLIPMLSPEGQDNLRSILKGFIGIHHQRYLLEKIGQAPTDHDNLFSSAKRYYEAYKERKMTSLDYDEKYEDNIFGHFVCRGFEGLKAIGIDY